LKINDLLVEPDDEGGVECNVLDADSSSDLQDVDEPGRTNRDLQTKMKNKILFTNFWFLINHLSISFLTEC
jgi:hypothetical protein